jgi:MmyB-like transcription regulator ligand binding domain
MIQSHSSSVISAVAFCFCSAPALLNAISNRQPMRSSACPECDPAAAPRNAGHPDPACTGSSKPSPRRRSFATGGWTCSPPTTSAEPCTPRCTTATRAVSRTLRATRSSATTHTASTPTGKPPPTPCVAILRTQAGYDHYDKGLHDLVWELSTRREDFRRRWSAHNVRKGSPAATSKSPSAFTPPLG